MTTGEGIYFMGKKLYVGNLSFNTHEDNLRTLFSPFGTVASAKIITDHDSGSSKGFGFVEMDTEEAASAAIAATNGRDLDGRQIKVNEAQDKPRRDNRRY
jgi:RNA recognition motif-containing protein